MRAQGRRRGLREVSGVPLQLCGDDGQGSPHATPRRRRTRRKQAQKRRRSPPRTQPTAPRTAIFKTASSSVSFTCLIVGPFAPPHKLSRIVLLPGPHLRRTRGIGCLLADGQHERHRRLPRARNGSGGERVSLCRAPRRREHGCRRRHGRGRRRCRSFVVVVVVVLSGRCQGVAPAREGGRPEAQPQP
jgi:hypothetical protein